jgi:photosystem II stability/assembly factor-like uncharacterized protein
MIIRRARLACLTAMTVLSLALLATACEDDDDNSVATSVPPSGSPGVTTVPGSPGTSGAAPTPPPTETLACELRLATDDLALVNGPSFLLGDTIWQLCIGGAGAGSSEKYLFRSHDGGSDWEQISQTTPGDPMPNEGEGDLPAGHPVHLIYFVDSDNGWMGLGSPGANLHRSQDGGAHWTPVDTLPPAVPVTAIAFTDAQNGTATTSTGTWTTADGGATWVQAP